MIFAMPCVKIWIFLRSAQIEKCDKQNKLINGNSAYIILVILLGSQSGKVGLFAQGNQDSESGK